MKVADGRLDAQTAARPWERPFPYRVPVVARVVVPLRVLLWLLGVVFSKVPIHEDNVSA